MNDAQRKVMERAIETIQGMQDSLNGYAGNDVITALRAQLDAPAEKVEPVAWRYKSPSPPGGYVVFQQFPQALADLDKPIELLYTAPPTVAQIAAQARAEAIEECAKVCESSVLPFDIDVWRMSTKKEMSALTAQALALKVRALKSGTTPTEGEKG